MRDAALCLDVLAGYTAEDPKTLASVGNIPKGGYTANLAADALRGKRLGLYGMGWRNQPLSDETQSITSARSANSKRPAPLSSRTLSPGRVFAELRKPTPPLADFDARGLELLPYDLQKYLERMGPNVALKTFAEFAKATEKEKSPSPRAASCPSCPACRDFAACLANPAAPPKLPEFIALKEAYLRIVDEVFARDRLDALVFPQMRAPSTPLHGGKPIPETTVGEINIAGMPGVTLPAGFYDSGAPFNLIFVGPRWSEPVLLACAFSYENATRHRRAPVLEWNEGAGELR